MKNKKNKPLKFKQVRINYGDYTKLVLVADKEANDRFLSHVKEKIK
jgi:hypothetical protein